MSDFYACLWRNCENDRNRQFEKRIIRQAQDQFAKISVERVDEHVLFVTDDAHSATTFPPYPGNQKRDRQVICAGDFNLTNKDDLSNALYGCYNEISDDNKMVVDSYSKWGNELFDKIRGDFAIFIYDRIKKSLLVAKDIMGTRPIFFYRSSDFIIFSSDLKLIVHSVDFEPELNLPVLFEPFLRPRIDNQRTVYKDFTRFPPAHFCELSSQGLSLKRYWYPEKIAIDRKLSFNDFSEKFRTLFFHSVKSRTESSKTGYMLSGGLDSTAIVSVADQLYPNIIKPTFSAVCNAKDSSEEHYIDAAISNLNVDAEKFVFEELDTEKYFLKHISELSQPFYYGNFAVNAHAFSLASKIGLKFIVDGFDGDSALSHGMGYFVSLRKKKQFFKLYLESKKRYSTGLFFHRPSFFSTVIKNGYLKKFWNRFEFGGPEENNWKIKGASNMTYQSSRVFDYSMVDDDEQKYHLQRLETVMDAYVHDIFFEVSIRQGLRVQYPFWDRDVIELCLSLPVEYKYKDGFSRLILRDALKNAMPEAILNRGSKGNMSEAHYQIVKKSVPLWQEILYENIQTGLEKYVDYGHAKSVLDLLRESTQYDPQFSDLINFLIIKKWMMLHHRTL